MPFLYLPWIPVPFLFQRDYFSFIFFFFVDQQFLTWRSILIDLHTSFIQHIFLVCYSSMSIVTAFVNMYVGFSLPWIMPNVSMPFSSWDFMKWLRRSLCIVLKCIALWVSMYKILFSYKLNSVNNIWSHINLL